MKDKYLKNVATLRLETDKCIGCEKCTEACPHGVFSIENGKAVVFDIDSCIECGACALNCPADALSVNAGTGCATAIIRSWFTGKEPECGCGENGCC